MRKWGREEQAGSITHLTLQATQSRKSDVEKQGFTLSLHISLLSVMDRKSFLNHLGMNNDVCL